MVPSGINVPLENLAQTINVSPGINVPPRITVPGTLLKLQIIFLKRTLFKVRNLSEATYEGVIDIYLLT